MSIRWTYVFIDRPAPVLGRTQEFWTVVTDTRLSQARRAQDESRPSRRTAPPPAWRSRE